MYEVMFNAAGGSVGPHVAIGQSEVLRIGGHGDQKSYQ